MSTKIIEVTIKIEIKEHIGVHDNLIQHSIAKEVQRHLIANPIQGGCSVQGYQHKPMSFKYIPDPLL